MRTFSYYNKYDMASLRTKQLESERPIYPYSGVRKPDMLAKRVRRKKNLQNRRLNFTLPLRRYQKALMMRAATRKAGIARAQIAVSEPEPSQGLRTGQSSRTMPGTVEARARATQEESQTLRTRKNRM